MKIVFQKVPRWEGTPHAEAELARRMLMAAQAINIEAIASSDMEKIAVFDPDIVVPLHFFLPKVFDAFTVGCMWNPTYAIDRNQAWDNIKSYDGYGVASPHQEQLVRTLKFKSPTPYLLTRLFPSTNSTEFKKPERFGDAVYIGTNWGKERFRDFFSSSRKVSVFGPREQWQFLAEQGSAYRGEIPFDGSSAIMAYSTAGIGLALHHQGHNQEGIPSMRPFEIAASGAVMIADQNGFIREVFGDNVLYLDTELDPVDLNEQLEEHINWVKTHAAQAQEMAFACHEIFNRKYSWEILLGDLVNHVNEFRKNSGSVNDKKEVPQVELIVRSDGKQRKRLFRALNSIQQQTYPNVTARIMYRGQPDDLPDLENSVLQKLPNLKVSYTSSDRRPDRGTQFYSALRSSTAEYIGFLDHDDILFQDHVTVLMEILQHNQDAGIVYSGSVRIMEDGERPKEEKVRKLAYFHDFDSFDEKAFITSNSYLVRKEKIPWHVMNQPIPAIDCREDRLFLKLLNRDRAKFVFSEKVTCAFYSHASKQGHSNEDEEVLSRGKNTTEKILYSATSPWSRIRNAPPVQEVMTLNLLRKSLSAIKNDVGQIVHHIRYFLKRNK